MKPNVLFLLIDALRADRCYGSKKTSKTPNLDQIIKEGTLFENAFSSSDGTPTSFASIFTGVYPFQCALRKGRWNFKLNDEITNFISLLKKNGYHCYATMPELWVVEEFSSFFENKDITYPLFGFRLNDGLAEKIIQKIESNEKNQPWFHFIHLMDAHKPISFPSEFQKDEYGLDDYDKMVSSIDYWLGKIFQKIDCKNTIIVFTADHGDYLRVIDYNGKRISFEFKSSAKSALKISKITPKFLYSIKIKTFLAIRDIVTKIKLAKLNKNLTPYEKRSLFKARSDKRRFLFDELFRVPLIFSGYEIPSEKILGNQVRSIDIFPTLAEIIGIGKPSNPIHGRSLVPLLKEEVMEEVPVFLESGFNLQDPANAVMGIRTKDYKYFRLIKKERGEVHLYDLKNDPFEENNIAYSDPDTVKEMEKYLQKIISSKDYKKSEKYERKELNEEDAKKVEEELRKLGYI